MALDIVTYALTDATAAREQLNRLKHHWQEFWFELKDFHDNRRWVSLSYGSFKECVGAELGLSEQRAYQLLEAATAATAFRMQAQKFLSLHTELLLNEDQARALLPLQHQPEQMAAAVREALAAAREREDGTLMVTARLFRRAVQRQLTGGDAGKPAGPQPLPLDVKEQRLADARERLYGHIRELVELHSSFGGSVFASDMNASDLADFEAAVTVVGAAIGTLRGKLGGVRLKVKDRSKSVKVKERAKRDADAAYTALVNLAGRQPAVHTDDFAALPELPALHPNAIGYLWQRAKRAGVLEETGEMRPTKQPGKNGHRYPVYRSLVYRGE